MGAKCQLVECYREASTINPVTIPLLGRLLIEASAGTGKTYTLSLLYLRLLLGIGQSSYHRPLTVGEILVVTFTRAATEELRYRIRESIHQLRVACLRGYHTKAIYNKLLAQISDPNYAAEILRLAELNMDEASIYTIHGFCQRILTSNAVESGVLFEYRLSLAMDDLYAQIFQDFWRRFFNPLPLNVVRQVRKEWGSPEKLANTFIAHLKQFNSCSFLSGERLSHHLIVSVYNDKISHINEIKKIWQNSRNEIDSIIQYSGVSKQSYNKKNRLKWLLAIDKWACTVTTDFTLPEVLYKFSSSVLIEKSENNPPEHRLFDLINELYEGELTLNALLFDSILNELGRALLLEKQKRAEIESDDLLVFLKDALTCRQANGLADKLASCYPVAMIDEFQDTDEIQYQIFDRIYRNRQQTGLILIGDPKQAIYQFRGADVFVYMKIKNSVDNYFTLDTNWRSSAAMIAGVNQLFMNKTPPFIFKDIPFIPVKSAIDHDVKRIEVFDKKIPAFQYYLLPGTLTTDNYRCESAKLAAKQICHFIRAGLNKKAVLVDGNHKKPISSSDIAILVRDKNEAAIIKEALREQGVQSVFLSNRLSVFESLQAKEVFWLLRAILTPQNPQYIYTALATRLFAVDMLALNNFQHNSYPFDEIIDEFHSYRHYWDRFGILAMFRYIMQKRNIPETLLAMPDGERILTDFMHLSELLQQMSDEFDSPQAFLRWFTRQMTDPNMKQDSHEQRLESDENLVKIITIHKSKGLEYPIVFIPFFCLYKKIIGSVYHDRDTFECKRTRIPDEKTVKLIEEELLAEDLRLCYVALTRAIYCCSLGLAFIKNNKCKFHESALGYLIQQGREGDDVFLQDCLTKLSLFVKQDIQSLAIIPPIYQNTEKDLTLSANQFTRRLSRNWTISSYSRFCTEDHTEIAQVIAEDLLPEFDIDASLDKFKLDEDDQERRNNDSEAISIHRLPGGAKMGTLMHSLLEKLDFMSSDRADCFKEFKCRLNLTHEWSAVLAAWLTTILTAPLCPKDLTLSQVCNDKKLVELAFYFPIKSELSATLIDKVCQQYDPLSAKCHPLSFKAVTGMLKGFIDLIFEWQGQFYILDYKSNWLGTDFSAYTKPALDEAMIAHRYDLQYQLYTLVLHRYLRQRIPNYNYEKHIGGVYYLFLRGMTKEIPGNGVFYYRPEKKFIEEFDRLFDG